jgi:hypothetical protein
MRGAETAKRISARLGSAGLVLLTAIASSIASSQSAPALVRVLGSHNLSAVNVCQFHQVKEIWEGSCGNLFGENPFLRISRAKKIMTGRWRNGANPAAVWAGEMISSDSSEGIEIEIYKRGSGLLRTPYGWFNISNFATTTEAVRFEVDTSHEVAPSDLDRQIVQRAAMILSSESLWNRKDTRTCSATDTKWSIYCAMQRATEEVTGAFHHRRPALQVVRQIVDARTAERNYRHRLMDYNNDPSTTLADVRKLFVEALARMPR